MRQTSTLLFVPTSHKRSVWLYANPVVSRSMTAQEVIAS